jgi:hypothetical protein
MNMNILSPWTIPFGVTIGNPSFIFERSIKCKTVKYIDQLDNRFQRMLGFNTPRFRRLIADWLVENMNPVVNRK